MKATMSQYQMYSIGIVAENKKLGSDVIEVCPIEITPLIDGEIQKGITEGVASGEDKNGGKYSININKSNTISAKWSRIHHTNKRTPPDVRRGERVVLYRYSNTDNFYWESMGMDDHLRKLETCIWTWSATQEEYPSADSTDPENNYSFEVSTHKKLITLRTAKADGEPFLYHLQLDTKKGNFIITDDVGNYVQLESAKRSIKMVNADKSIVHLNSKKLWLQAPEEVRIKSGGTEVVYSPSGTKHTTPKYEGIESSGDSGFIGEFT